MGVLTEKKRSNLGLSQRSQIDARANSVLRKSGARGR